MKINDVELSNTWIMYFSGAFLLATGIGIISGSFGYVVLTLGVAGIVGAFFKAVDA